MTLPPDFFPHSAPARNQPGNAIEKFRKFAIVAFSWVLVLFAAQVTGVERGNACGWWGDGETSREDKTTRPTHDGEPLPETLSMANSKLPNQMGYSIAVPEPGRAIPYLQATYGRRPTTISELKSYGFEVVIDLGAPDETATLHRSETEALGMTYFNIPVIDDLPSGEQAELFSDIVLSEADKSLLVYAPSAHLLGMMWASHRIRMGSSLSFAIAEGRMLGLTEAQETVLRDRAGK